MTEKLRIFYDKNCQFCTNTKNLIQKLDKNNLIEFEALEDSQDELKAIDSNGNEYFAHEGLRETVKILPAIQKFSWMFEGKAGEKASSLFYSGLKKVRDAHNRTLGKKGCKNC